MWRPSFNKYLHIFQREYNISRNDSLTDYSWDDIQNYITVLPMDRVITFYEGKNNNDRYLEALCDRDVDGGIEKMENAAEAFEEKLKQLRK